MLIIKVTSASKDSKIDIYLIEHRNILHIPIDPQSFTLIQCLLRALKWPCEQLNRTKARDN